jgi:predicted CopG family antitoxin
MESTLIEGKGNTKKKRHWKSGNLPRVFTVRADDEEYEELKKMTDETGWSLSRLLIEGTLSKTIRTAEQVAAERADVEEMIFQMRRVGINLNQITAALNAVKRGKKVSVTEEKLEAAVQEVESLIREMKKKLWEF